MVSGLGLRPLSLTASHSNWRLFMVRKSDPGFLTFQQNVFLRDGYTCQFCGFQAKQYMDVVNVDNNFHHNTLSNLSTSCCICSQSFFLESVGRDEYGGGVLIVLPELSQNEVNALCHTLFVDIVSGNKTATEARSIYRSLKLRSQPAEKALGPGMSNPSLFGRLLVDAGQKKMALIQEQLQTGVRLLPELPRFVEPVTTWIRDGLKELEQLSL